MLHVDPQQRITAQQILQHRWVTNRQFLPNSRIAFSNDSTHVKAAMKATYNAINKVQTLPALEPVSASLLAQRRGKGKT
ncbi:Ribosomal protein S6 kinase 2 alpha [Trichinella spiralis]